MQIDLKRMDHFLIDLILAIMEASIPTSSDNKFWFVRSFIFNNLILDL